MNIYMDISPNLTKVDLSDKSLDDYAPIVPETVSQIRQLSGKLKGLRVTHINATSVGGGVAEMLKSIVPLQRNIGLDSNWYVIPPNQDFFKVTKEIHNLMQGKKGGLTQNQKKLYLDYNNYLAGLIGEIKTDVLIIHDPQPLAALNYLNGKRPRFCIWRCHIDTSHPNKSIWNFMLPYIRNYDRYVFTMDDFVNGDLSRNKIDFITPVIDPLAEKNKIISKDEARNYLKKYNVDPDKPLMTQVSRLDPWKDPEGVVDAWLLAKKKFPDLQLALVAQMASDDPEGAEVYKRVQQYIKGEKGIFLLVSDKDNAQLVQAFQAGSEVVLQKSLREGFGLTVTEAMWKNAVVVGGNVGGIRLQIKDEVNGFLVNSPAEAAERVIYLLEHPEAVKSLSEMAHISVRDNFLLPHKVLNYLLVFSEVFAPKQHFASRWPLLGRFFNSR